MEENVKSLWADEESKEPINEKIITKIENQ